MSSMQKFAKGIEPNPYARSCADCRHCQAVLSWWCMNKACVKWRGTQRAGGIGCPFWEPAQKASWLERHFPLLFGVFLIDAPIQPDIGAHNAPNKYPLGSVK